MNQTERIMNSQLQLQSQPQPQLQLQSQPKPQLPPPPTDSDGLFLYDMVYDLVYDDLFYSIEDKMSYWDKKAREGDAEAMFLLGKCYLLGIGTEQQNLSLAQLYLNKSAELGNMNAYDILSQWGYILSRKFDFECMWWGLKIKTYFKCRIYLLSLSEECQDEYKAWIKAIEVEEEKEEEEMQKIKYKQRVRNWKLTRTRTQRPLHLGVRA